MTIRTLILLMLFLVPTLSQADMIGSGGDSTINLESTTTADSDQTWWDMIVEWFVDDES